MMHKSLSWRSAPRASTVCEGLERRSMLSVGPVGAEFEVGAPQEVQWGPAVGMDADGDFAVSWARYDSLANTDSDVRLQRFAADGAARGTAQDVAAGAGRQDSPGVALDGAGNSIVAWADHGIAGPEGVVGAPGIYARRYDASGAPRGDAVRVFDTSAGGADPSYATRVEVAADASGAFVIAWSVKYSDARGVEVMARRYDAAGAPRGDAFRVNSASAGFQGGADVAIDGDGDFVITWAGNPDEQGESVYGQRFSAAGERKGPEFVASASPSIWGTGDASVDTDDAGNFVVSWTDTRGISGEIKHVVARRFDAAGTALGAPFQVDDITTPGNTRASSSVAVDAGGEVLVVWLELSDVDGDVYAREYHPDGSADGPSFRVNTSTDGQVLLASAAAGRGSFVVTWLNQADDFSAFRVRGQRLGAVVPPPPAVTAAFVNGSAWSGAFRSYLGSSGLGGAAGYQLPLGDSPGDVLPWINIDQLVLVFSRPADPKASDLRITGVRSDYTAVAVAPVAGIENAFAFTLDRNLGDQPGGGNNGDLLMIHLTLGDGTEFRQRIDVLQGDVNRAGSVVASDFSEVKARFFKTTTNPGTGANAYTPFHDVDGSGNIAAVDFSAVKSRFFDILPDGTPAAIVSAREGSGAILSHSGITDRVLDDAAR